MWRSQTRGYRVPEKWLAGRKERTLSRNDVTHYRKNVVALRETMRLMKEIDQTILSWPTAQPHGSFEPHTRPLMYDPTTKPP